ncbi:transposase [Desulfovibrio ferrophilus]|uniref:Putative Transposase, ISXO2 n=1 Tax=Desulfovibrio ferrophilus TaxID=241368 RepID=A0A2Z6ATZ8_9BACT|nr:transposase [Desulfovibrio ferrophilus]BBD06728.1 putative Transposase, ISXO2 [Desulfovibrio ferrophilus]
MAYNTVYKAMCLIRRAILTHAHDAELYQGPTACLPPDFCNSNSATKAPRPGLIPVFGLMGQNGDTVVSLIPEMRAETVYYLNLATANLGQVVYTDRYQEWETLIFCGKSHIVTNQKSEGSVHVDGSRGFWSFCKTRLHRMSGVSALKFPLYLKELEFRYRNRGQDIFPLVAGYLCDFMPKLD